MKWVSKWDDATYDIKPAHGTIEHWKSGRCWSVFCSNAIMYVNISRTGKWKFGYCYGDYQGWKYQSLYNGDRQYGTWYLAMKGKLTKDRWPKKK